MILNISIAAETSVNSTDLDHCFASLSSFQMQCTLTHETALALSQNFCYFQYHSVQIFYFSHNNFS